MEAPIVYIDSSEVREGALEELRSAIGGLAEFVEENVPGIVAYAVYFTDDGRRMTVVHVHSDPTSLDQHMEVSGPEFRKFGELLTLRSIDVYGEPSAEAVKRMEEKARMLGSGALTVHRPHAGFIRIEAG
jgi:Antibiotic biosynthesis monooxygenase